MTYLKYCNALIRIYYHNSSLRPLTNSGDKMTVSLPFSTDDLFSLLFFLKEGSASVKVILETTDFSLKKYLCSLKLTVRNYEIISD